MRVPSDEYLLQSLAEIRHQTASLYQQLQDQVPHSSLALDREITRRLRQIDGMILSLNPRYGVPNIAFCRDLFRILNTLRSDLNLFERKIHGEALPDPVPDARSGISRLYSAVHVASQG